MAEHEQAQVPEQQANLYYGPAPRFTVGDVLSDGTTVHSVGWHVPRKQWWVTTQLADGTADSGGIEPFFANRTIVIRAADKPSAATPENPPQVGDKVRLTTNVEGIVYKSGDTLCVSGWNLDASNRTVEILERAEPILPKVPLPTEDGYYVGYDKMLEADIVVIVVGGKIRLPNANNTGGIGHILGSPERFAPFQKLTINKPSTTNTSTNTIVNNPNRSTTEKEI